MKQILLFAIMFLSPMVGEAQGVSKLVGHLYYDGLSYVGWINYDSMEDCDNNRNGKAYVYVHNSSAIDYYNYDENIPSGHLVIRNSVTFENISWLTSDITFPVVEISLICKKNITSVTIPKSVKIIGGGGFLDCPNLKYAFFENDSQLERLGGSSAGNSLGAFFNCGLLTAELPKSINKIDKYAFAFCDSLEELIFPASLGVDVEFASRAIVGCNNLKNVYAFMPTPFTGDDRNFVVGHKETWSAEKYVPDDVVLHVPDEAIELYRTTKPWSNFKHIVGDIFEEYGVRFQCLESNNVCIIGDEKASDSYVVPHKVEHNKKTWDVTAIAARAFMGKRGITELTIPHSIRSIGENAFFDCVNVKTIHSRSREPIVLGTAKTRAVGSSSVFDGIDKETCVLYVPEGCVDAYRAAAGWNEFKNIKEEGGGEEPAGLKVGDVFGMKGVPGTYRVTSAKTVALCKWSNADGKSASIPTSVTYSDGTVYTVTSIGGNETGDPGKPYFPVFVGDVESIAIPATVTELGGCMAYGAINLTSITIPATVTSIGQYAFAYSGLTSVTVEHATPLSISENTFEGVYEDATLIVPAEKVSAYKGTTGWKKFKTIKDVNGNTGEKPDQPSAGSITFADAKVERICLENWDKNGDGKLSKEEAAAVKSLGGVFNANEYNGGREEAGGITSFNELQYFTGLESIGRGDFDFQLSLTAVVIPANVQTIEKRAFFCCEKLTSVQIPGGVSYIGQDAFNSCGLRSITIPASVKTLGTKAFAYTNLEHVYVEATTPPEIEKDGALQEAFISNDDWIYKNAVLHVPTGSESLYKVAPGWKQFWTHSSGTAIDGVVPDGEPFDVYDLQGRKVCSGVTSLEGLPKGVYIVKGRKIIK